MNNKSAQDKKQISLFSTHNVLLFLLTVFVFSISILSLNLARTSSGQTTAYNSQVNKIRLEKQYWQEVVIENPDYLDGWLTLATITWQIGETEEAREYLNKAKYIKPNSEKLLEVSRVLGAKTEN